MKKSYVLQLALYNIRTFLFSQSVEKITHFEEFMKYKGKEKRSAGLSVLMDTLMDFFNHLFVESLQVLGRAAGYESLIGYHFLILPVGAGV